MNQLERDLEFVRTVVENSRRSLRADARPLLAWGLLTLIGIGLVYLFEALDNVWFWIAVIGLAWGYTGWRTWRRRLDQPTALFAQRALTSLWFAVLTSMSVTGFIGVLSGSLPSSSVPPIIAAYFGAGYLASAALMAQRWPVVLAIAWWLVAAFLFLVPEPWRLAAFGAALLFLLVLPSLQLMRR
jgi:hypothetical protein